VNSLTIENSELSCKDDLRSESSAKRVRACVLGATFDTPNMGVGALAAGTAKCILHRWPNAEIFLLDYGKEPNTSKVKVAGREVEIPLVNMRFSKKPYQRNHILWLMMLAILAKLMPSRTMRARIIRSNPWLRRVDDADLVLAMSGGDSFSDIYGLQRLAYVSLPQILVLLLGKDLVVLPQTLGPFKSRVAKIVASFILGRAAIVYSRDQKGLQETVAELSLKSKQDRFRFNYDVGFALDPVQPAKLDVLGLSPERQSGMCRVGLNVSGLLWMGGYTGKNMFGLRADYRKMVYQLIDKLMVERQAEVLLIPHVFGEGGESDSTACVKLFEELQSRYLCRLGVVNGRYDQGEIKHVIGTCDFFVGSRMHACIAALSQCVPAVAIAYSDKFIGVLDTIGMKDAVADPRFLDEHGIVEFVMRSFAERESLKQRLERKIPDVRTNVLNLFSKIEIQGVQQAAQ